MRATSLTESVRFRVTVIAAVVVLIVLSVTGATLVVIQRRVLLDGLHERAVQQLDATANDLSSGRLPSATRTGPEDDTLVRITTPEGVVVRESVASDDFGAAVTVERAVDTTAGSWLVEVSVARDDVDEATGVLVLLLVIAIPAVVAVLSALVWWLVGRTLEPVEAIRREAASIGGGDLHRRVPEPGTSDEIGRLARTMNGMLDRIESASNRQQQFVADASHELRSPLTRMRTELEVDLRHPGDRDPQRTVRSVLDEALAMQQLIDDLLFLARRDADTMPTSAREPVDLSRVVDEQVAAHRRDDVAVTVERSGAVVVWGDARALGRALGNVVQNAVRHARSTAVVELAEDDGSVTVTVADDGEGVPVADQDRVFERFARADDARSRTTGGTGLGLAIARDVVEQHGGTIAFDPATEVGARVIVRLPRATTEA